MAIEDYYAEEDPLRQLAPDQRRKMLEAARVGGPPAPATGVGAGLTRSDKAMALPPPGQARLPLSESAIELAKRKLGEAKSKITRSGNELPAEKS